MEIETVMISADAIFDVVNTKSPKSTEIISILNPKKKKKITNARKIMITNIKKTQKRKITAIQDQRLVWLMLKNRKKNTQKGKERFAIT